MDRLQHTNEVTHKNFTLANTMGEIELVVCVHKAHPIIAPPITKGWVVVVPEDFVMRPVHLFHSNASFIAH
eukprot:COSAG02_NODE_4686_length_5092_cov_3.370318_5_plen_71_part_00